MRFMNNILFEEIQNGITVEYPGDTLKHLSGTHNQARHAWRYGGNEGSTAPARRSMSATPNKAEREEYKKRARQKLGMPEKPERKPGETGKKPDKQNPTDPKEAMRQKAVQARERLEAIENKYGNKIAVLDGEMATLEGERNRLSKELIDSSPDKRMEMVGQLQTKIDEVYNKQKEINTARYEQTLETRHSLRADNYSDVRVEGRNRFGKGDRRGAAIDDGVEGFTRLVDKSVVPDGAAANFKKAGRGRASAWQNDINMTTSTGPKTVVHELGHWLENNNPAVRDAAYRFLERRTQGEPDRWLGDITGVRSYGRSERAKADRFISAYMGKQYFDRSGRRYGSEILSMGLEMFYSDPVKLARQDPEYFDFIYGIVRGVEL